MWKQTDMDCEVKCWPHCDKNLIAPLSLSFVVDHPQSVHSGLHLNHHHRDRNQLNFWQADFIMNDNETTRSHQQQQQQVNSSGGIEQMHAMPEFVMMQKESRASMMETESNSGKVGISSSTTTGACSTNCQSEDGAVESGPSYSFMSLHTTATPYFQPLRETIELLVYYYREHGVALRPEELKNLVEIFVSQVFDTLKNGMVGSPSSSSSSHDEPCASSSKALTESKNESLEHMRGDSLSCPVCYGVLLDPVTIECGHSYCKQCLQREVAGYPCRRCQYVLTNADVSSPKTNVLLGALVEKWWPSDNAASELRMEGNALFENRQVDQALTCYTQALDMAPEDHLSMGNRSHALLAAGRSEEALQDAKAAIRYCPTWPKGHFRKSAAFISLGRYEEAFISLTICMYLIRANTKSKEDSAYTQVINEMIKILHKIFLQPALAAPTHRRYTIDQLQFSPYPSGRKAGGKHGASTWIEAESFSGDEIDHSLHFPTQTQFDHHPSLFPAPSPRSSIWKSSRTHGSTHPIHSHHHMGTSLTHSPPVEEQLNVRINRLFGRASQDLKSFDLRLKGLHKSVRHVNPNLISNNDVECSLCYRLLFQPVSTGCGHTFCRSCLDRCLDHNPLCPLCKTSLQNYLANREHAVTEFLEVAIRIFLPKDYEERLNQHMEELNAVPSEGKGMNSDIPIFVCTMAFPTIPCPLHVFEPRYRLMIRRCMENKSNRFGMCCYIADGEHNYGDIGTLLEIRDVQYFADGRSVVDTIGCRRFRVLRKSVVDGYNTARIELLHDRPVQETEIAVVMGLHDQVFKEASEWLLSIGQERRQRIHSHFGLMPAPEDAWQDSPDGPSWIWWLLAILPLDSKAQLAILTMCSLQKRLECILKVLNFVKNRMSALGE